MDALWNAWLIFSTPAALGYALCGVFLGLVVGGIPGLGGIFGLALLIPVTYGLDAHHAIYLLLGLTASTTISDTIPAVLIGVPGSVGASPTAIDGHQLAQQGQTARVLGAAYLSSLLGGLVGAAFLALTVPLLSPVIFLLKIPDFFALGLLGLGAVILVSKGSIARGIVSAGLGLCASFIGLDAMTGEERWTFSSQSLWDGLPIAAVFFGVFCLPELAHLSGRKHIAQDMPRVQLGQLRSGIADVLREWKLVGSSGALASFLGLIPGIGLSAISWITYALAAHKTRSGPAFGDGNIRGVIAAESAANATEGGTLIPTVTLGVPGSASMALLLAALTIQGIVPGPGMLSEHADLTFSMVFALVFANMVGTMICIAFTNRLAYLALLPARLIVICALVLVFFGTYQINSNLFDLYVLCFFGALGFLMKKAEWSRPALLLGFVLGPVLEQNFTLTTQLYGPEGFTRPTLIAVLLGAIFLMWRRHKRKPGRLSQIAPARAVSLHDRVLILLASLVCVTVFLGAGNLSTQAYLFPVVSALTIIAGLAGLLMTARRKQTTPSAHVAYIPFNKEEMYILLFLLFLTAGLAHIGPLITTCLAVMAFLYRDKRFSKRLIAGMALMLSIGSVILFSKLAHTSWPATSIENDFTFLAFLF